MRDCRGPSDAVLDNCGPIAPDIEEIYSIGVPALADIREVGAPIVYSDVVDEIELEAPSVGPEIEVIAPGLIAVGA